MKIFHYQNDWQKSSLYDNLSKTYFSFGVLYDMSFVQNTKIPWQWPEISQHYITLVTFLSRFDKKEKTPRITLH